MFDSFCESAMIVAETAAETVTESSGKLQKTNANLDPADGYRKPDKDCLSLCNGNTTVRTRTNIMEYSTEYCTWLSLQKLILS